jgi:hypothetical protein
VKFFRRPKRPVFTLGGIAIIIIVFAVYFFRDRTAVTPSTQPAFVVDPGKPFIFELGRGSGWGGLDIVEIRETGVVRLQRAENRPQAESTTLNLTRAQVKELVSLINEEELTRLGAVYDGHINDGTQWVLWIRQGSSEKAVYFDNAFPRDVTTVADRIDAMLQAAGLPRATWAAVPGTAGRDYQMALWNRTP